MGTCASKCFTGPLNNVDSDHVEEKLVISESSPPPNPLPADLICNTEVVAISSSCSSSSSSTSVSSPNPSTSPSFSPSSSSSSPSANCSPQPPPRPKATSSTKGKLRAVTVDREKQVPVDPEAIRRPIRRPPKLPVVRSNPPVPAKRSRSCSPASVAERRSFTAERGPTATLTARARTSSSPKLRRSRSLVGGHGAAQPTAVKKNVRPSTPCDSSSRRISSMGKETCFHQIRQPQLGQIGSREAFPGHISMVPPMEDLNNPLISMDCFIFL
ncbi:hypothetical protein B296_00053823 [Ensete ventricosum]|uniref:Uncharacterized protein n=1 Tax=Ensete ventricosum TaxID=4639 RepID=A0A426XHJ8_ENSVE|nr:hypothetical protein B296_00053823 [Ensete ventricosum]